MSKYYYATVALKVIVVADSSKKADLVLDAATIAAAETIDNIPVDIGICCLGCTFNNTSPSELNYSSGALAVENHHYATIILKVQAIADSGKKADLVLDAATIAAAETIEDIPNDIGVDLLDYSFEITEVVE